MDLIPLPPPSPRFDFARLSQFPRIVLSQNFIRLTLGSLYVFLSQTLTTFNLNSNTVLSSLPQNTFLLMVASNC